MPILPECVVDIMMGYASGLELREWVDSSLLNKEQISKIAPLEWLMANPQMIEWNTISLNPHAYILIKPYLDALLKADPKSKTLDGYQTDEWCPSFANYGIVHNGDRLHELNKNLASNSNHEVFDLLSPDKYCLYTDEISQNPAAFHSRDSIIIRTCPHEYRTINNPSAITEKPIDWDTFRCVGNSEWLSEREDTIEWLRAHQDAIYWPLLSANPHAIDLLKAHKHRINPSMFSRNRSPDAIAMILAREVMPDWVHLSGNPTAIDFLGENKDKVNYFMLSGNSAIFYHPCDLTALRTHLLSI